MTGNKILARALQKIFQCLGMPMNKISAKAMQIILDMMHDLMEKVMEQDASYADNEGRVKITSKSIMFGSWLAMHNIICPYCEGCP